LRNVNWRAASGQSGADFMRSQPIILAAECNPSGQRWCNPECLSRAKHNV
jgi:hypothetical protein